VTRGARFVGWLVLAVVLVGALVVGTVDGGGPQSPGERARDLAESIACPRCDGQSVADSDSDAAKGIRSLIEQRISEGASDAQIRDELAEAYGEQVLLTPGRSGAAGLVWALPVMALVAAAAGLAIAFRRWRAGDGTRASDADRALVAAARDAGADGPSRERGTDP
jgi:cytochrome c-type biogenesis protein CcmH